MVEPATTWIHCPAIRCPAIQVPEVEPCPAAELDGLIDWLGSAAPVERETAFSRGTALPDGRVDLCKQSLGVEGVCRVVAAIEGSQNPHVRSLLLGTDGLGDAGAQAVAAMVEGGKAPALETLYLGCNHIELAGVEALSQALASSESPVRALWLKRNPVGPAGAARLAELLRQQGGLELLDLTNAALTDAGVEPLAAALIEQAQAPRGLKRLLIGSNGVGPRGAAQLAEVLAHSPHLVELGLAVSRLGDDGARALAAGLARNRGLERLDLGSCAIGPEGLAAIVEACRVHPCLVELDLGSTPSTAVLGERDNDLRDCEGAELLAAWLADDPCLQRLDLHGAGVRSRGVLRLLDALASNHTLVELRLGKYVARRLKRKPRTLPRRNAAASGWESRPPPHVAAILSVYRSKATR